MDDDIQQLLNLGLKMMGLFLAHRGCFIIKDRPVRQGAMELKTVGRIIFKKTILTNLHRFPQKTRL
jgi:hypothetical protein